MALVNIQARPPDPERASLALRRHSPTPFVTQEALEDPFDGDTLDDIRLSDFQPPGYATSVPEASSVSQNQPAQIPVNGASRPS